MNLIRPLSRVPLRNIARRVFSTDFYDPPYLDALKPPVPIYDTINVHITGYDYAILESYQAVIHNIAKNMELDVEDGWAVPHTQLQVTTLKPNSDIVNAQMNMNIYQRFIQLTDVYSTQLPLFIRAVEASAPAGVTINVVQHADHYEEERYIPDQELETLKQELDVMGGPSTTKKTK